MEPATPWAMEQRIAPSLQKVCCGCRPYGTSCIGLVLVMFSLLGCHNVSPGAAKADNAISQPSASFLYPIQGLHIDPFTPFSWKAVKSATGYYLQVGTTVGGSDIFAVGELPGSVTTWPVDNLLPGTYWARLFTHSPSGWSNVDISFLAAATPPPSDRASFYSTIEQLTSSIRLSSDASTNTPLPGSPLAAEIAPWGRSNAFCTDYSFTLVQLLQAKHIYARSVTLTMVGGTSLGHTVVEYYDPFLRKWSVADATFGLVYFDDSAQQGQSAAELSGYVFAESWSQIHAKFVTPNGKSYMNNYYLDPVTLYLNVVLPGKTATESVVHDPKQFLVPVTIGTANPQGYYTFAFSPASDTMEIENPPGSFASVSGRIRVDPLDTDPLDSSVWSAAFGLNDGWWIASGPADVQAFTFRRVMF